MVSMLLIVHNVLLFFSCILQQQRQAKASKTGKWTLNGNYSKAGKKTQRKDYKNSQIIQMFSVAFSCCCLRCVANSSSSNRIYTEYIYYHGKHYSVHLPAATYTRSHMTTNKCYILIWTLKIVIIKLLCTKSDFAPFYILHRKYLMRKTCAFHSLSPVGRLENETYSSQHIERIKTKLLIFFIAPRQHLSLTTYTANGIYARRAFIRTFHFVFLPSHFNIVG